MRIIIIIIIIIIKLQLGWHQVAAVQHTFTHKQYTEQNNQTEHTERNILNNKNIHKMIKNVNKTI
jgi:hypothetical protein